MTNDRAGVRVSCLSVWAGHERLDGDLAAIWRIFRELSIRVARTSIMCTTHNQACVLGEPIEKREDS